MTDLSKIYVYAIIDSNAVADELRLSGFNNNPVYSIPFNDIAAVVCDFSSEIKDIKAGVVQHEKTVEKLMETHTVLPMRFQTIFNNKDNVVSTVEKFYVDFKNNLERLYSKVEFGVKVLWSGDKIKEDIIKDYDETENAALSGNSPAKEYLKKKYKAYKIDKIFKEKAEALAAEIDKYFVEIAVERKLKKLQTDKLLLNAAYLIEKSQKDKIFRVFKKLKKEVSDLEFLFSGPWPAYNFIKLKKKDV
jgi:hypothetical protein